MGPLLTDMTLMTSFMDSRSEGSGTSFSGEDCPSPSESERGGEKEVHVDRRGKRRVKNRDAARKTRKKQTERADHLHETLQTLERSNSALVKEIASLRIEFQRYTTSLEQHESLCTLRSSSKPPNAPCCQLLPPSTSSIAPVTTPGPAVSPQPTPGSLLTPVTGGQRVPLTAPASLALSPLSTLTTVPSAAQPLPFVTNLYPLLSTLYTPISNIAPLIAPNNLHAPLTTPITNVSPLTTPIKNYPSPTTPITHLASPTTPITNLSPLTTPITNLAPPTTPAPTLPSISYPLTLYPLNLSTPAIDPPLELSLSDILDSPDWLCDPASPTWGGF